MDLEFNQGAFRGIHDAFPEAQILRKGIYMDCKGSPNRRIALISMKCAVMENERIKFWTRDDEHVNLKLNCRENLQLTTSPVELQLRDVEDEDDVGDVALVIFNTSDHDLRNPTYWAVCDGLILSKFIIIFYYV